MDVNNTWFHLRLGFRDWEPVIRQTPIPEANVSEWATATGDRGIAWDPEFGGIALLRQVPLLTAASALRPSTGASRGAAVDGFRNVFWISDDGREIQVQPSGARRTGKYWSVADLNLGCEPSPRGVFAPVPTSAPSPPSGPPPTLRGIAATADHHLAVGMQAPSGLLIFDLDAGDSPCLWRWPVAIDFRPWLIVATADGGVAIVDFNETTGVARLWQLDRTFTPVDLVAVTGAAPARRADFSPVGTEPTPMLPTCAPGEGRIIPGKPVAVTAPVGLAALPDGSLLLLDAGPPGSPARIVRLRGGRSISTTALDASLTAPQLGVDIAGAGALAVVVDPPGPGGAVNGRAYMISTLYPQAFELAFVANGDAFTMKLQARALPTTGGASPALAVAGDQVLFQSAGRWFPLEEQPRYRYLPAATLCAGQPVSDKHAMVFDGKEPGCVWHRILADACIPAGCEVQIRSRAADDLERLERAGWTDLHPLQQRSDGSELPFDQPFGAATATTDHLGTFETLIMSAEGRHLQLEITLVGDGRASPKIRALRIYYPRFSYLHRYLPAIYREDGLAADFLDRWLANPEGILTTIEGRIASAETVLDPATAPLAYLDWLASWFDAMLDPDWDEGRRRLFLKFAWLLYQWRGSALGLLSFLRLAIDECPDESVFRPLRAETSCELGALGGFGLRVVEDFERRQFPPVLLGDPTNAVAGLITEAGKWNPRDGGSQLHALFREWLLCRYGSAPGKGQKPDGAALLDRVSAAWELDKPLTSVSALRFSAVPPSNPRERADWEAFAAVTFDFGYPSVSAADLGQWREFLARRYGTIEALNQAWGRTGAARWAGFGSVPLPSELPSDGTPLDDWRDFISLALPIRRNAHRFTVLVPARVGEDPAARATRLRRVEAIVEAEKPAHTSFEVKPFWALFQIGSARIGLDTVLGESSRFLPMVLDAGYLREGYLAEDHPWTATDRQVIGRDRIQRNETWTSTTAAHSQTH